MQNDSKIDGIDWCIECELKVSKVHRDLYKSCWALTNWKGYQEELEKKKAAYAETMKNKIALVHKEAEEKRAMVDAIRGEELLKAEEMAAKYRATGQTPKKLLGCFWSILNWSFWESLLWHLVLMCITFLFVLFM